ncbi:MAG: Hpt domain-containing protein [Mollicutes bacterium]|jgi:HPt (histidine-containing phosphotransfer) domain-containing protein|nr:Hpt domain-containing protein [Mollicutes bacterium]
MKDISVLSSNGVDVEKGLELLGDMETYEEILLEFLNQSSERLENLKKYKDEADMANYAILVHALKSDSKYLGFTKLAELAYQHEMESKANNTQFVNDNFDELMKEANRIIEIIHLYLEK